MDITFSGGIFVFLSGLHNTGFKPEVWRWVDGGSNRGNVHFCIFPGKQLGFSFEQAALFNQRNLLSLSFSLQNFPLFSDAAFPTTDPSTQNFNVFNLFLTWESLCCEMFLEAVSLCTLPFVFSGRSQLDRQPGGEGGEGVGPTRLICTVSETSKNIMYFCWIESPTNIKAFFDKDFMMILSTKKIMLLMKMVMLLMTMVVLLMKMVI